MAKSLKDIYVGVKKNDPDRHEHDFYPTPPLATFALIKNSKVPSRVVEPCAGRGNISIELMRNGIEVISKDLFAHPNPLIDIETGIDFMEQDEIEADVDGMVTNPPYHKNLPTKIAEKSINSYTYTAMLVRLTFLEGKARHSLFTKYPPTDIIIFSDRVRFGQFDYEPVERDEQLGGMICYAWVVWRKDKNTNILPGTTNVKWVKLEDLYDEWRVNYDLSDLKY